MGRPEPAKNQTYRDRLFFCLFHLTHLFLKEVLTSKELAPNFETRSNPSLRQSSLPLGAFRLVIAALSDLFLSSLITNYNKIIIYIVINDD